MKKLALLVLVTLLAGCASTFRSDVSTFHTITASDGKTFAVTPMNPDKIDSLEYKRYAASIVEELTKQGFTPVGPETEPDLVVGFDISQSEGREELSSRGNFNYYSPWYGGFYFHRRAYFPFAYGYGYGANGGLRAETIYPTTLFVEIHQLASKKQVFEGRAVADTKSRSLPEVVPLLAKSLFVDFPGPDGKLRRVSLKLEKTGEYVTVVHEE